MRGEKVKVGSFIVCRYEIIGTGVLVCDVWEPNAGHTTIRNESSDGRIEWYGRVGTRKLPPELNKLPAWSDERMTAVTAFQDAQNDEAYTAILEAFPDIPVTARRADGQVEYRKR